MLYRNTSLFAAALVAMLFIGGIWLYRSEERRIRNDIDQQLASIAELKVAQILQWRHERLSDAAVIVENALLRDDWPIFLSPQSAQSLQPLLAWFQVISRYYTYSDILLVDAKGRICCALSGQQGRLGDEALRSLQRSVQTARPVLSDLHTAKARGEPHLDVAAPLFRTSAQGRIFIGGIILRSNAHSFLYPVLQHWPVPSQSAESVLVRGEDGDVLYLNELRHHKHTALNLRVSRRQTDVLSVMAVNGKLGMVEGQDYRGKEVLAVVHALPQSSWFMVTKIDKAEVLADWNWHALLLGALFVAVALSLATGASLFYHRYLQRQKRQALHAEMQRLRADAKYHAILMSVGDGVIVCDETAHITLLNPVAAQLTGWSLDQALGHPVAEVFRLVHEESRTPVENPIMQVLRQKSVVSLAPQTVLLTPEGLEKPIADSAAPIIDEQGALVGSVLVFRDQSEERRREHELRLNTYLMSRAEHLAGMGAWQFLREENVLWLSPSARSLLGVIEETLTQERVYEIVLPESRSVLHEAMQNLLEEGLPYSIEFKMQRPDTQETMIIHAQAEFDREHNRVFGVLQDLTARRKVEAVLSESESRYRSLFQNNHSIMLLVDPKNGRIMDANPAAVAYYGWERDVLLGKRIDEINTLSKQEIQQAMEEARQAQRQFFEFKHRLANGQVRDVEVYSGLIYIEGQALLYSIVHDCTEKKEAEAQRERLQEQLLHAQKLESVGRLAGGIAHDLNNLLSPILGYGELLLHEIEEGAAWHAYAGYIMEAASRSRDLVRQLMAFGRRQTLLVEPVQLGTLVQDFSSLLRRTLREDITLEIHMQKELPLVRVDRGQIEQVLMNLVVNAQDAMPEGGLITFEIVAMELHEATVLRQGLELQPGRYVMLQVADTGCGIASEIVEHIFTPFFTTKEMGKGTGLGLATAYGIVKQHQGDISVEGNPGQGAVFRIYLPEDPETASPATPQVAESEAKHQGVAEATILVVEDNQMVRRLAVDILRREGYHVLAATDGTHALRMLHEYGGKIALLVTDVVMPTINGKMLFEQAQELYPDLQVLYMSGYTENVIAVRGILATDTSFVQKPFTPQVLLQAVAQVLA